MPEFVLDTAGEVKVAAMPPGATRRFLWGDLDSFTQGYIEAAFFTSNSDLSREEWDTKMDACRDAGDYDGQPEGLPKDCGFSDLAPEALAAILEDCRKFQDGAAYNAVRLAEDNEELGDLFENHGGVSSTAGRDFWYTRNGHGCGFWDGDWPEPYATALTDACKAFGEVDLYLGDDGKVRAS